MDDRLSEALKTAKLNETLQRMTALVREELNNNLKFAYGGARFIASIEMISYVESRTDNSDPLYLTGINGLPVLIKEPKKFLDQLSWTYESAMATAHEELERLRKNRNVNGMTSV